MKEFVQYIITQGQGSGEGLEYSKLPQALAAQDRKLLAEVARWTADFECSAGPLNYDGRFELS